MITNLLKCRLLYPWEYLYNALVEYYKGLIQKEKYIFTEIPWDATIWDSDKKKRSNVNLCIWGLDLSLRLKNIYYYSLFIPYYHWYLYWLLLLLLKF